MEIEIELKFLVSPNAGLTLTNWLEKFTTKNVGTQVEESAAHLTNTYYDTQTLLFRQHDIGVRTRSTDGVFEQTIKTRGQVVGGVHRRGEYNIDIADNQLQLAQFPSEALPPQVTVSELQDQVIALFTTDFHRRTWLIRHPSCVFEMVFDHGFIDCEGERVEISEVELELKSGEIGVVFEFARKLVKSLAKHKHDADYDGKVRLGYLSKAARGYQLFHGKGLKVKTDLTQVPLEAKDSIEQAFIKTVEYGLGFMQHHEQCFVDSHDLQALRSFCDGVLLIRHGIWQYNMLIGNESGEYFDKELSWLEHSFDWVEHGYQLEALMSKTGKYRKRLELNSELASLVKEEGRKEPDLTEVERFFSQPRYNHLMLDLSRWLIEKGWRGDNMNLSVESEGGLQLLSCKMLTSSWQSLLQVSPSQQFNIEDYVNHHQQLKRSLLTGTCVGGLYSDSIRNGFRNPWFDLSLGIDELKTLHLLQSLAEQVCDNENSSTLNWLAQQTESLLHAMEHSRLLAIKMKPYWSV